MESRPEDDYKELRYIRNRFISVEGLREAVERVISATLAGRDLHSLKDLPFAGWAKYLKEGWQDAV